jgi:hypothetical protein
VLGVCSRMKFNEYIRIMPTFPRSGDQRKLDAPPGKALPGVGPTAYFRPDDYVPEFGPDLGIPLYSHGQTRH